MLTVQVMDSSSLSWYNRTKQRPPNNKDAKCDSIDVTMVSMYLITYKRNFLPLFLIDQRTKLQRFLSSQQTRKIYRNSILAPSLFHLILVFMAFS